MLAALPGAAITTILPPPALAIDSSNPERIKDLAQSKNPPARGTGGFLGITSLTITYFHMRMHTIIGAKSFHGPVRDGKGWYQLAMVIRHNL